MRLLRARFSPARPLLARLLDEAPFHARPPLPSAPAVRSHTPPHALLHTCSIYLIGMMGSGKSTLGRMLANTLKYGFFDTDELVSKAHDGKSIAALWTEHGEPYFRECEKQARSRAARGRG